MMVNEAGGWGCIKKALVKIHATSNHGRPVWYRKENPNNISRSIARFVNWSKNAILRQLTNRMTNQANNHLSPLNFAAHHNIPDTATVRFPLFSSLMLCLLTECLNVPRIWKLALVKLLPETPLLSKLFCCAETWILLKKRLAFKWVTHHL